jgi:two-component system response regulator YesN
VYIMLVDDEQWIVAGLAHILRRRYPDITVESFTDPRAALQSVRKRMPDLMITDIRMPLMSGLELIEHVRALGLRFYAVLTGLDDTRLLQHSLRLQAADYLIKPVSEEELFRLTDRVQEQLSEYIRRCESKVAGALRLCAMYGDTDEMLPSSAEYRGVLIARYMGTQATLSSALCQRFALEVELWQLEECCWLYLSKQPPTIETEAELRAEAGILRFVLAQYEPGTLHALFLDAMRQAEQQQENPVAMFCASPLHDDRVAAILLHQMRDDACAPDILDVFCKAVGIKLPYWQAVELAAQCLQGRMGAAVLGVRLRALAQLPTPHSSDVRLTLEWLQTHFREHITLAQAAANVYLQANYFTTLFKKETDTGFIQYLNELRVDAACRGILKQPQVPFEQVARDNGFASVRYFFATFKKYTSQTPSDYRLQTQQACFAR